MELLLLILLALGAGLVLGRSHGPVCDSTTQTEERMAFSVLQIEIVGLSLCRTAPPTDRE
jgi:hypothetical protein